MVSFPPVSPPTPYTPPSPNPYVPHAQPVSFFSIHPNIIHPFTPRSPQWSSSLRFPYVDPIHHLSSPIRATCPAHLILLDFITRTKPDELISQICFGKVSDSSSVHHQELFTVHTAIHTGLRTTS